MERKEIIAKLEELGADYKKNAKTEDLVIVLAEAKEMKELEDAEAKIEAKAAKAEVAETVEVEEGAKKPLSATQKAGARQEAHRLIKCIITPLDDKMKTLPSEMYSVGNRNIGFVKKVVRFGVITPEPKIILDTLKEKKALIQQTMEINGKPVTRKVLSPAFAIQELEFTAEELAEFKK